MAVRFSFVSLLRDIYQATMLSNSLLAGSCWMVDGANNLLLVMRSATFFLCSMFCVLCSDCHTNIATCLSA